MSELPPTGPPEDVDPQAPAQGSPGGSSMHSPGREFDTKDTQEIPVSGIEAPSGAANASAAAEAAEPGDLPADPESLRSVVLSRVRETREELLRLIDRFLEQQDRRARAAEEERRREEQRRQEQLEREEAERRERERVAALAAADTATLLANERDRAGALEGLLALHAGMPDQVSALQTDLVAAGIELERQQLRARELAAAAERAAQVPVLETRLAAAERRVARAAAVLASLRRATLRLDEAASQTEVLARLLEEATGFASRSALFLVRRPQPLGDLRLAAWGACGFSEQGAERIEVLAPPAWQAALDGRTLRGGAELGAPVALASDSEAPLDALIVPFILRDETRALLYVDRFDPDHPFDVDALQLLCFVAAHALEVLPLRHKRPAGTLGDPEWAGAEERVPPAGSSELATIDVATTTPTALPLAAVAAVAPPPSVDAVEATVTAEPEPVVEEHPVEAPPPPPWPADSVAEEPAAAEQPASTAAAETELVSLETIDLGEAVSPLEPRGAVEMTTQEVDVRAFGFVPRADDSETAEPSADEQAGAADGDSEAADSLSSVYSPSLFGRSETPVVTPGRAALDSLLGKPAAVPPPPPDLWRPAAAPQPPTPPPAPAPPAVEPKPVVEPAPPVIASAPPTPTTIGREVVPPSDIEGPGWAFAAGRRGGTDEEHAHEEAKRLARLLVSELQLYNEEEIDEGRRQGNVYRFLKEHIDKSRMLYEERVDEKIRQTTDYFREELVKSLAGGDPGRLGF